MAFADRLGFEESPISPDHWSTEDEPLEVSIKVVIEKQAKEYVAYPLGVGVGIAGHGSSVDEALADLRFIIASNVEEYGSEVLFGAREVLDAFVQDVEIELP